MNKKKLRKYWIYIPVLICSFILVIPVYWLFISSIQIRVDTIVWPPYQIPPRPTIQFYLGVFFSEAPQAKAFRASFFNSIIIASLTTVVTVILGSFTGYVFSRQRFRGKTHMFMFLLGTQMIPEICVVLPLYVIYAKTRLLDTHLGLILLHTAILLPYVTWIMKGFFDALPLDFEESAMIDGCTKTQAILRIVLPLSAPGLAACAMFCFVESWNEFFFAFILTGRTSRTVQAAIGSFMGRQMAQWGLIFAGAFCSILPMIIFILIFRKYIVQGLTKGGLKF